MGEFKGGFASFLVLAFFLSFNIVLLVHCQLLPIVSDRGDNTSQIQTYIVHVLKPEGSKFLGAEDLEKWHKSFLPNNTLDTGEPRLLYSYKEAISGFAARLTPEEVRGMEKMDGFLCANPSKRLQVQTTYTHKLLNLSTLFGAWSTSNSFYGEGIIIGVLDTGIHLPHPSFADTGMPPVPRGWNASCNLPRGSCNGKVIGAQSFRLGNTTNPATDIDKGHGTHVAGIAAGNFVDNADVLSLSPGRASGMAPKAYISVYKVCWVGIGCSALDIIAGIDQAILDGVHILQMSIGSDLPDLPISLGEDEIAIATFSAMQKGIFPCTVAGNNGPDPKTLSHAAPWDMVVGATTMDRRIRTTVTLGNGKQFHGESAYQPNTITNQFFPLAFPGSNGQLDQLFCLNNSLNGFNVKGKIVMCEVGEIDDIEKGGFVRNAGGAGMILMNFGITGFTTFSKAQHLPVSHVSYKDAMQINDYFISNSTPTAKITFGGTIFGIRPAPALASFSSRGLAKYNRNILKPDVTAPGVNILSAWPVDVGPFPSNLKKKTFNFLSGTSMAAPHVSGIVALIMSKLKNDNKRIWSTSEIQSALITTANPFDLDGKPIFDEATLNDSANILQRGAGQVNATNAMDPGLVYNIKPDDYVAYLCGIFSNDSQVVQVFTQDNTQCTRSIPGKRLNYPSIGIRMKSRSSRTTIKRTVTNVGDAREIYNVTWIEPPFVKIYVSQYKLSFTRLEQQITYRITFTMNGSHPGSGVIGQGQLSWVSNKHTVTSPIYIAF
ncbi:Tripeptidyl-peptidase II protein [Dioscorea alata]|uniref:Tripeptidyl-peptidase II protein n=1 Tax=Dioscorea alata TaxID=55571 RepID=A0ACB7WSK4_DIOAL|nr:Tripeptidyl-peptidase II protein [Dioscorea alata]